MYTYYPIVRDSSSAIIMSHQREESLPSLAASRALNRYDLVHASADTSTVKDPLLSNSRQVNLVVMEERKLAGVSYLSLLRRAVAEMLAVFLIVFTAGGATIVNAKNHGDLTLFGLAAAGGLAVTMMIFSVGQISGGHVNPAVTIAFASTRTFPLVLVPIYIGAQFVGAITAAAVLKGLYNVDGAAVTVPYGTNLQSFFVEFLCGFNLMFVATAVTTGYQTSGELAGIAIGATVTLNVLFAGPVSGASMNPARSLGPAIVANNYEGIWIYLLGPTVGAVVGTWAYKLLYHKDEQS